MRAAIGWALLGCLTALATGCDDGKPGEEGERGPAGDQVGPRGPASEEEGPEGPDGPEGPEGPATDVEPSPALAACLPGAVYLGHVTTLTVSADDTSFAEGEVTLDLGDSLWIEGLVVASPTALVADVEVDLAATPGDLDVVVAGPDGELTLPQAISVLPSLEVQATRGALATGSSFLLDVVATDPSAPLDPGSLRVELPGAEGVHAVIEHASAFVARVRVNADVFAEAAELDLVVHSGGEGREISSRGPGAVAVAARAPVELDLGAMPADVAAPGAGGSHLYAIDPPSPLSEVKLDLVASGGEGGGAPTMIVIPPSGVLSELIASGTTATFLAEGDEPYFVLVIDESGVADYVYDLVATVTAAAPVESEPNDVCGGPGDVVDAFPANFTASLADDTDEDWFRLDLDAAEGAQRLRVRTTAGEADTDVELTVFADDCTTVIAGPRDIDFHENLLVDPAPGEGTFFVRVRPSPTFPYRGSLYKLALTLEP